MRIFKNHTDVAVLLEDHSPSINVDPNSEIELTDYWSLTDIQNSPQLASLISQGSSNYQLNELKAPQALAIVSDGIWNAGALTTQGLRKVTSEPREGSETLVVSHNWCDPTTWFTQSERVEGEALADSGDGLIFNSLHDYWIDLTHGNYYNEHRIADQYVPSVYIDGVKAAERDPFADTGGDFVIDYKTGNVTFTSNQSGKTITADYSRANGSLFIVSPKPEKVLIIEESEVQFSKDVVLNDSTYFQAFCYNPYDLPNKVAYGHPDIFKTIRNFIDEARGVYPEIPALGGLKRGLSKPHLIFPFKYQVSRDLPVSLGVEARLWLENDIPHTGEFATITFYCTSRDE